MIKKIRYLWETNDLENGREIKIIDLHEKRIKFIENKGEGIEKIVVAGLIFKEGETREEIVRIGEFTSSRSDFKINIANYKNLEKGDQNYDKFYKILK